MNEVMADAMVKPFDLMVGRKTYQIFAAFWPASATRTAGKQA
jgi:hypothetical protein